MDYMATCEDNAFDLAIVDPPYGIWFGEFNRTNKNAAGERYKADKYKNGSWDACVPDDYYFCELFRVSENQIVWGGNYFPYVWRNGGRCFVFWHKGNPVPNFSDGELAWTSFDSVARMFDFRYYGGLEGGVQRRQKYTQRKSQFRCTSGCLTTTQHLGSGYSIPTLAAGQAR